MSLVDKVVDDAWAEAIRVDAVKARSKPGPLLEALSVGQTPPDVALRGSTAERASQRQVGGDHYKAMDIEPWDVVDTWPLEQRIGAYRHGALKYLMRMGSKDESPQEIGKGQHYMQKLLEVLNENKGKDQ